MQSFMIGIHVSALLCSKRAVGFFICVTNSYCHVITLRHHSNKLKICLDENRSLSKNTC